MLARSIEGGGCFGFRTIFIYILSRFTASCTLVRLCVEYSQLCSCCSSAWDLCFPRWPLIVRKAMFLPAAGKMEHTSVPWEAGRNLRQGKRENLALARSAHSQHTRLLLSAIHNPM